MIHLRWFRQDTTPNGVFFHPVRACDPNHPDGLDTLDAPLFACTASRTCPRCEYLLRRIAVLVHRELIKGLP